MKLTQLAAAIAMTTASISAVAATYSVTPLPLQDVSKSSFGQSIDESGFTIAITSGLFNPPVDVEQLEQAGFFETYKDRLENVDEARDGIFSNLDYTNIVNTLLSASLSNSVLYQHLATYQSFITDGVDSQQLHGLDEVKDALDGYSQSVQTMARDSVDGDFVVGTTEGMYFEVPYTNEDDNDVVYILNDKYEQAFVQVNGNTKSLSAPDTSVGGS